MSPIEKRGEATTTEEKGFFDLEGAKQKIALVIELKRQGKDEQLNQELADPFLSVMVDALLQWGDAEEKKQAMYVAKLLEWEEEAKRLVNEERISKINQAFNNDPVKVGGFGENWLAETINDLNYGEEKRKPSALPEAIRKTIVGREERARQQALKEQQAEQAILADVLSPLLEQDLEFLAGNKPDEKNLIDNKYDNKSGEYILERDQTARQLIMNDILIWGEALQANKDAQDLSLTLRYKPLIADLKIKITEENLKSITDKEERKRLEQALKRVKKYVREYKLLPQEQTDLYFRQTKAQEKQEAEEKKKKVEKGNPFANFFRRKHGISEVEQN